MLKRNYKVILVCMIVLAIFGLGVFNTFAHQDLQYDELYGVYVQNPTSHAYGYEIGGEEIGWIVDETEHSGQGTNITFSFHNESQYALTESQKQMFRTAAAMWNVSASSGYPDANITITEDPSMMGVGLIYADYVEFDDNPAQHFAGAFYFSDLNDSDGHSQIWYICINKYRTITTVDAAHELGHAIGLLDLEHSSNSDKLMYGFSSRSAVRPTDSDVKGARVISGQHSEHSWTGGYVYAVSSSPNNAHRKICSVCDGYSLTLESCAVYDSNNRCIKCKMVRGVQIMKDYPEETLKS